MPKNVSLEHNRVIGKEKERKGPQGRKVNMRLWIDVIHFRFESSWKKNKKRIKTKKEFTRFVLNEEGKVH